MAQLRLSTAIAYHMPGATMTLTGGSHEILIAPTSEARADLHPGDLRDLVHLALRRQNTTCLYEGLNFAEGTELTITIRTAPPLFESLGAGLYVINPPTTRSVLTFPTLLIPRDVEAIIADVTGKTLGGTLDYDETLNVTIATFEKRFVRDTDENDPGGMVGRILAECAVAEEFPHGSSITEAQ